MLVTLRTLDEHGHEVTRPIDRAALLADVASICIESIEHDADHPRRRWPGRAAQIREIAQDNRIASRSTYTRRALIDEVMNKYGVTYSNAKTMINRARQVSRQMGRT